MTTQELRDLEVSYQAVARDAEALRKSRNVAIALAIADGWTHAQISEATGLSRGRIGQLAQTKTGA